MTLASAFRRLEGLLERLHDALTWTRWTYKPRGNRKGRDAVRAALETILESAQRAQKPRRGGYTRYGTQPQEVDSLVDHIGTNQRSVP
jgi:hypothetical protein